MLILALDTSSPAGSIAVLRDDNVIAVVSTWVDEIYSSRMFRHLDFILHELSLGLEQIDVFAVAAGPGSFTGLRVGLTAVKGWAEVFGKRIAAVSALEAVAVQSSFRAGVLAPVLDARRSQVYYALYRHRGPGADDQLILDGEQRVATPAEFLAELQALSGISACRVVTPEPSLVAHLLYKSEAANRSGHKMEINIEQASSVLAPSIGRLAAFQAKRGQLVDALALNANYVRRSDAERQWTESKVP